MTEPVNNKTLGGLTYNANQVSSTRKLKNGKFEITFKTGEKLTYPQQKDLEVGGEPNYYGEVKADGNLNYTAKSGEKIHGENTYIKAGTVFPRNAKVTQSIDKGIIYDDTNFDITNVMGATFTSSKDTVAHVNLNNSSNTTINLAANDSKLLGDVANIEGGANNKVILDKNDKAKIDGTQIEGDGTAAQKDYR